MVAIPSGGDKSILVILEKQARILGTVKLQP